MTYWQMFIQLATYLGLSVFFVVAFFAVAGTTQSLANRFEAVRRYDLGYMVVLLVTVVAGLLAGIDLAGVLG